MICINCGHDEESHQDRYGCQVEGGDKWVDGTDCGGWMAQGPCGCKDFTPEDPHGDPFDDGPYEREVGA